MSTAVRILILVGSIAVYLLSYFIITKTKLGNRNEVKKISQVVFACIGGFILFAFLFINPDKEIFLSIKRVKIFSTLFIVMGLALLFIFYLIYMYKVTFTLSEKIVFVMILVTISVAMITMAVIVASMLTSDMSERYIEKVNQTESYERIEPYTTQELKTIILEYDEEGKVTLCKYEYVDGTSMIQSEISGKDIENVVYIKNEDSYIELTKISTDYINKEMNPEAKGYSFTETEEKYTLYINESQTTVKY